jgi:hypothetical protein
MAWKAFRRATGEAVRLAFRPGVVVSFKAFAGIGAMKRDGRRIWKSYLPKSQSEEL